MALDKFPTAGELRKIKRHQPLVAVFAAAAAGILLDRCWPLPLLALCGASGCAWCAWLLFFSRGGNRAAGVCLLAGVALLFAAWHHSQWRLFGRDDLGLAARDVVAPVCVEAHVFDGPKAMPAFEGESLRGFEEGDRTQLILSISRVRDGRTWKPASGRAFGIVDGQVLGIHTGDTVRVFGRLVAPRRLANPGGFDSASYHRCKRRLSVVRIEYPDGVTRLRKGSPWGPWRNVERLRNHFEIQLQRYLGGGQSPLALAILLGGRQQMEHAEMEAFLTTGTIHLIAISGFHVSILVSLFMVFSRLGLMAQGWAMAIAMAVTVVYAFVSDPRPPVVRATILTWMMCLAWFLGRETFSFNTLAAAALAVLAFNPTDLFNAGAQLSFLAVGTLAWFAPLLTWDRSSDPLQRLLAEARSWPMRILHRAASWVGRLTLASLAVWLVACPLVAYHFHVVSPVAILLTLLLWIPVTLLLYAGFGVLVCGWLLPPVASLFGWLCDAMLRLLGGSVQAAQGIPAGYFWVPGPPLWWIVGLYGGLVLLVVCPNWRPRRRWCYLALGGWFALGAGVSWAQSTWFERGHERLSCTFISVGHGSAVLLELPDGRALLYDAGGMGPPQIAAESISDVLWARGIRRLDAVVLSHADSDHYNALPILLGRFSMKAVYLSPGRWAAEGGSGDYLLQTLTAAGVPLHAISAGESLPAPPSVRLDILHPPAGGAEGDDNANSVVLLVEFAGRRILLPGDLDEAGLDAVLQRPPLECDVVMAPHHGRRTTDPTAFLEWSSPEWIVVSARSGDVASHVPMPGVRGTTRVLHTGCDGAVQVTIDRDRLQVSTWRRGSIP